ncbi:MAG: NUDIX hydrolase [Thalassotalea sp.]
MRHLKTSYHQATPKEFVSAQQAAMYTRLATRAIVLRGNDILMLYTKRYHDYSLPGGGVDENEPLTDAFIRELQEETGAQAIKNIQAFGIYEEYRPWTRDGYQVMKMVSYCYTCEIALTLGDTQFEAHEINNGMMPVWMNIDQAIAHNLEIIANSDKKGLSVERETFLLKLIKTELVGQATLEPQLCAAQ